jgi:hypothetical protein
LSGVRSAQLIRDSIARREEALNMTGSGTYFVSVALVSGDRAGLLSLASMLHRRGIDVLEAEFSRPSAGRRVFNATVAATPRQASTLEASLRNLIDVVGVFTCEALDTPREPRKGSAPIAPVNAWCDPMSSSTPKV